jgi:8-oxo-dGTP pyrophosphatase MutT (NUDIX family)
VSAAPPIPAATVVLVRPAGDDVQVFLLRRHRASSFMSNAFVFPGGKIDPEDGSPETAAVRELYEEAGVLLCEPPAADPATARDARRRLNAGEVSFPQVLALCSRSPAQGGLHWWARWVTPSAEPRRFDATFFVAELPPDQSPSFDDKETVEELWIAPGEAIARQAAGELRLPPPQLRTMFDLRAAGGMPGILAEAARRQAARAPIMPRIAMGEDGIKILLPWDPEYLATSGEGEPIAREHILATPPSRFVWTGSAWREM